MHGRADERSGQPTTLSALAELTRGGYVGREDGEALSDAYAFLRTLEHRIQLYQLRRTHVVPEDERVAAPARPEHGLHQGARRDARRRSGSTTAARYAGCTRSSSTGRCSPRWPGWSGDEARLTPEAATQRLAALGFADPAAALRHLEALTAGVTRTANIQRQLLPAMLDWFAEAPDPDAGLFGFRRISESLGRTPWYLKTLRDEGQVAERLAKLLATSRYASDLLEKEPAGVRMLGEDLAPLEAEQYNQLIVEEMLAAARPARRPRGGGARDPRRTPPRAVPRRRRRHPRPDRRGRRRRRALADHRRDPRGHAAGGAWRRSPTPSRPTVPPARMAVVAMGRYGGFELSYGSDADVLFVHEPAEGVDQHEASSYAMAVGQRAAPAARAARAATRRWRSTPTCAPRASRARSSRSLESYAAYYAKWSKVWEAQALLRADAVVGDPELRQRFVELIDPLRYPEPGPPDG